ncbi:MAG: DUF2336 domain-containing protein [Alphaproteobacteria bacterium]|nr:DUF2336 domain-containing protein [Alphaproteobacteria bacterium]
MTLGSMIDHGGEALPESASQRDRVLSAALNGPPDRAALLLRTTTALSDDDLIAVVRDGGLDHQLAVARRERLSRKLTAALAAHGAPACVAAMLENRDAKIAPATLSALVERSRDVIAYRVPLLERPELEAAQASRLYLWVSPALRDHIARHFPIDRAELDRLRAKEGDLAGARVDEAPAATLIGHLRQGEPLQFEASFARLMRLRITSMRRIIEDRAGDHLAVACRAAGFTREQFQDAYRLLQAATTRLPTAQPGLGLPTGLVPLGMIYDRIDEKHAQETVKRWRREPTASLTAPPAPSDQGPLPAPAIS